jgi:hypothetical protein
MVIGDMSGLRAGIAYWLSDDPKIVAEREKYIKERNEREEKLRAQGYVLIFNDVAYTQKDIDEGKTPFNGLLKDLGLKGDNE